MQRLREEALRRHLCYLRDGQQDTIPVFACPMTVLPDQVSYIHYVTLTIQNALKRLPDLYQEDAGVREVLRITPDEEAWLADCWGPATRDNVPIFGRLDAMIDFLSPMWKDSLRFVEPNLSGIGGLHLVPTSERIVADVVVPVLRRLDPELHLHVGHDIRQLLMQEVLDHLETLHRPARHLCFVEPKYAGSGPDEQEALARHFHDHFQIKVTHADPSELTLAGDEVCYGGDPIDLAYRDYPVADLIELAKQGVDVRPMRTLFRQNRMISSIAAEMDQKSCWEILSDPHVHTTLLQPRRTAGVPPAHPVDAPGLAAHDHLCRRRFRRPAGAHPRGARNAGAQAEPGVRRHRRRDRSDGGTGGVGIGDRAALADPERWVVQQLASIPVSVFPVQGPDGAVHFEPFYTVMGFAPSKYGVAILGRASQKQVVNVAQRGGICAVLIGQAPGRLHGPAPIK